MPAGTPLGTYSGHVAVTGDELGQAVHDHGRAVLDGTEHGGRGQGRIHDEVDAALRQPVMLFLQFLLELLGELHLVHATELELFEMLIERPERPN